MKLIIEFNFMISHCKQMNDVSVQRVREADYMKDMKVCSLQNIQGSKNEIVEYNSIRISNSGC